MNEESKSRLPPQYFDDLLRYVNEATETIVVEVNEQQRIVGHNSNFRILLRAKERLVGQPIGSVLDEQSCQWLDSPESQESTRCRLRFNARDGSSHLVFCQISKGASGQLLIMGARARVRDDDVLEHMTRLSNETINLARDLKRKNRELQRARSQLKVLGGVIPICMHCKNIRDDAGYWKQLEEFISDHSEATFSHGICDACIDKYYSDLQRKK